MDEQHHSKQDTADECAGVERVSGIKMLLVNRRNVLNGLPRKAAEDTIWNWCCLLVGVSHGRTKLRSPVPLRDDFDFCFFYATSLT